MGLFRKIRDALAETGRAADAQTAARRAVRAEFERAGLCRCGATRAKGSDQCDRCEGAEMACF